MEIIIKKQKRLQKAFDSILLNAYCTAFDQEDLMKLLDDDLSLIYLYGDAFTIPLKENVRYVGVLKKPKIICEAKSWIELQKRGISIVNAIYPRELLKNEDVLVDDEIISILEDREPWNIGNIEVPNEIDKQQAISMMCEAD